MSKKSGGVVEPTRTSTTTRLTTFRVLFGVLVATIVSVLLVTLRVSLNPDIVALLPSRGDSAVLGRYLRGFGGGGIGVILIEGDDPASNKAAADELAAKLGALDSVSFSTSHLELGNPTKPEPLLAWRVADPKGRERLAQILKPEGMRERIAGSRTILLAPGGSAASTSIAADPMRLAEIPYTERSIGSGVKPRADGYFATEDGSAFVVIVKPKGQALKGKDAKAFVDEVEAAATPIRAAHPGSTMRLTGPHAVAAGMEAMLRRDLTRSGIFSTLLASLAFALVFRRVRALLAVAPPLALGTLWTAALAAAWPKGISAIAVAFTSIVVGVGFDTGVHVYAALLEARRDGLSPREAVAYARNKTARPVLIAATIAAVAFGSLALSSVEALGQLGLLCGAGELLTAIAIVLVTPEIGGLLERGTPPPVRTALYTRAISAATRTRLRAGIALAICLGAGISCLFIGVHVSDSLVAVRPKKLAALAVEDRIYQVFGGRPQPFIVLVADPDRDEAMHRADKLAETLARDSTDFERVDALTSVLPAEATQRDRLAERDALDLPARAAEVEKAREDTKVAPAKFADFLDTMRAPKHDIVKVDEALKGDVAVVASRYLAEEGGEHLVAIHVHLTDAPGARDALERTVASVDPKAKITGYARLEADLRGALATDLPRIAGVAGGFVLVLLALSLRRVRDIALATGVLIVGIGALLGFAGLFKIPLHIYSALVIPVLLGISVDEAMFLLHRTREEEEHGAGGVDVIEATIEHEATPIVATALTTSAGLVALVLADYEGLRDLGIVGAVGNGMSLVMAVIVVPAGLRLLRRGTPRKAAAEPREPTREPTEPPAEPPGPASPPTD
ncbi:MAG: MMPL family transporter [Polyangiaceae bacterium]